MTTVIPFWILDVEFLVYITAKKQNGIKPQATSVLKQKWSVRFSLVATRT